MEILISLTFFDLMLYYHRSKGEQERDPIPRGQKFLTIFTRFVRRMTYV